MHYIVETAHALFAVVFFLVIMPLLAFGGFGLMMHGVNEMSDTISTVGLIAILQAGTSSIAPSIPIYSSKQNGDAPHGTLQQSGTGISRL